MSKHIDIFELTRHKIIHPEWPTEFYIDPLDNSRNVPSKSKLDQPDKIVIKFGCFTRDQIPGSNPLKDLYYTSDNGKTYNKVNFIDPSTYDRISNIVYNYYTGTVYITTMKTLRVNVEEPSVWTSEDLNTWNTTNPFPLMLYNKKYNTLLYSMNPESYPTMMMGRSFETNTQVQVRLNYSNDSGIPYEILTKDMYIYKNDAYFIYNDTAGIHCVKLDFPETITAAEYVKIEDLSLISKIKKEGFNTCYNPTNKKSDNARTLLMKVDSDLLY